MTASSRKDGPTTRMVSIEIFQQIYESPASLPGKERWTTRDDDARKIEVLLGMEQNTIGAALWVSGHRRRQASTLSKQPKAATGDCLGRSSRELSPGGTGSSSLGVSTWKDDSGRKHLHGQSRRTIRGAPRPTPSRSTPTWLLAWSHHWYFSKPGGSKALPPLTGGHL